MLSSEDVSKPKYMQVTDLPLVIQHYCFKRVFSSLANVYFGMLYDLNF